MEKIKKAVCEQNGITHKEIENPKRNQEEILELKSTVTENESFTRGIQRHIWADKRISEVEDRTMGITEFEEQKVD